MTDNELQEVLNMDFLRVPNLFFKVRPKLKPSEFDCLLFIWQKTGGWNKTHDYISISQFTNEVDGLNITRRTVQANLKSLKNSGLIDYDTGYNNMYNITIDIANIRILAEHKPSPLPKITVEQGVQIPTQGVQKLPQGVQKTTARGANSAPTIDTNTINTNTINNTINKEVTKKDKKEKFNPMEYEMPSFIDLENWHDFVEMRSHIKKPLTAAACKRIVNKLVKFNEDGYDANQALDNSVIGNYQGVFQPSQKPTNHQKGLSYEQPKLSGADSLAAELGLFEQQPTIRTVNSDDWSNVRGVETYLSE